MNIRKYDRVRLSCDLDVYDRITGLYLGKIVDISVDGMMISGDNQINTNTTLYISVDLPETINGVEQLHCACITHWWKKASDIDKFLAGLTFKNLETHDKQILEFLIKNHGIEE